ncbi:DUF4225 domain-containing protein [Pseudomonas entomophila]|uniref:Uncharacterized protein n=2 Tax=Pseudomonas entomophila TaxID=312306 RepID=Q1IBY3_PSEE4|nr:hypothetical protein PSEEN1999 [Pseudomonas entomophila L48]
MPCRNGPAISDAAGIHGGVEPVACVHSASKALGYGEREGDIAYLGSDMALSIGVLFRPVLRPDAWRLFKYYRVDK